MEEPTTWRKSSYTGNGDCVEVAFASVDVGVRDSKQPSGPRLNFDPDQWRTFLANCMS
jgi:uncharacterized protein DUF397